MNATLPLISTTDVYPTRYAAFDRPGEIVRFEPRADGMYRHCRDDSPYIRDLTTVNENVGTEAIVFHRPSGERGVYDYAEAIGNGRTKAGVDLFAIKVQRNGRGAAYHVPRVEGVEEALRIVRDFVTGAWDPFKD